MLRLFKRSNEADTKRKNVPNLLRHSFGALCRLVFYLAAFAGAATAQTPPTGLSNGTAHQTQFTWTASTSAVAGYNLYCGPTTGSQAGTQAVNGTTLIPGTTYTDTKVTEGQKQFCVVTAQAANGNQSAFSNEVSFTTPANPPPPTNLSITTVAVTPVGNQDRLQVDWTDAPGSTSAFTIFGGQGQVLKQGSQSSSLGVYSIALRFPPQSGIFVVCNQAGTCVAKAFQG